MKEQTGKLLNSEGFVVHLPVDPAIPILRIIPLITHPVSLSLHTIILIAGHKCNQKPE